MNGRGVGAWVRRCEQPGQPGGLDEESEAGGDPRVDMARARRRRVGGDGRGEGRIRGDDGRQVWAWAWGWRRVGGMGRSNDGRVGDEMGEATAGELAGESKRRAWGCGGRQAGQA